MSNAKKTYATGLYAQRNEKAPSFLVLSADIVVDQFTNWLKENQNEKGRVKVDFTKNDDGRYSATLNTWKPKETVDF